ncbi:energy-coupling factor ABC transporter ATP-binding protein [Salidesulfovibrio brasiliensis]|uniref:energy-coupling factor ABC transporter ATP-binding protein n=1 Tax=Salidesulfovibrio brasiliensis TaxID=221711 RepID=UPI0006CF6AD5|nr:ABC transporter ATP-binding protein [Salidesulfovibrio brasiliensis]
MRLEVRNLTHSYDDVRTVLDDVSLSVEPGERLALVGRNGAGKSTLAKICCGLIAPVSGSVTLNGTDVRSLSAPERASNIGYVFQDPSSQLFAATVRQELEYGPKNVGFSESEIHRRVDETMEITGISELADHNPHDLSLSRRRLVAFSSVVAMGCRCLILDEPTAGLDMSGKAVLTAALDHLRKKGVSTVTITHDMDFCAETMSRVIGLHNGAILRDGPPEAFFDDEDALSTMGLTLPRATQLLKRAGLPMACTAESFMTALRTAVRNTGDTP